ncbi:MAG TPA: Glu/Leu/Phe/Val dehydrogenase dimerization domain-containing protein [Thermoanaerobaculia bacterium]|nr:Glu/Leu/Phe/Val dehydrogenase dimerization domain-containing protein [Thermoanaerobaculia bacterium]
MSATGLHLEDHLAAWDGLGVVCRHDAASGAWIFIALHDARRGAPTGGTRIMSYASPTEALEDAMRLAAGMTAKWAVIGVPFGGGKAVIAPPGPLAGEARRALLRRYGRLVESLHGSFVTGEDLGTTPEDMAEVARATRHVLGGHGGDGLLTDPGPFTAHGVVAAMAAICAHLDGQLDGRAGLAGRRVAIQGVGDVGAPLARQLAAAGASLVLSDTDPRRLAALAEETGAETVTVEAVYETPCDLFAPCAVGAVLNEKTISRLACRAVCGSANNQLASDRDAERLHDRGILYAPDYVANAGGAIAFARLTEDRAATAEDLFSRVETIGPILEEILAEAAARRESPLHAAHRRVARALAAAPDQA